jgi:DNA-binding response OmpR family regulator
MRDKKVVLVIDDEPFIVDMVTTFLEISGYEVHGATNGLNGLTLIPLEKPDVLLLDLMLPDIEGFEVCTRVRTMPDFAHLPILIISARTDPESKARAEKAGANGYLTKPLRMADLVAEIKKLLSAPPAAPEKPAPPPVTESVQPAVPSEPVKPEQPAVPSEPVKPDQPPPPPGKDSGVDRHY